MVDYVEAIESDDKGQRLALGLSHRHHLAIAVYRFALPQMDRTAERGEMSEQGT